MSSGHSALRVFVCPAPAASASPCRGQPGQAPRLSRTWPQEGAPGPPSPAALIPPPRAAPVATNAPVEGLERTESAAGGREKAAPRGGGAARLRLPRAGSSPEAPHPCRCRQCRGSARPLPQFPCSSPKPSSFGRSIRPSRGARGSGAPCAHSLQQEAAAGDSEPFLGMLLIRALRGHRRASVPPPAQAPSWGSGCSWL